MNDQTVQQREARDSQRLAISLEFARWQMKYGSGDAQFFFESDLVGWRVANWQAERDDVEWLEDLSLEYRLGYADDPLKDMHWRDEVAS